MSKYPWTRRITHLHGSAHFTTPLNHLLHFSIYHISNLSTIDFKLTKSTFLANFDVSTLFKSDFDA